MEVKAEPKKTPLYERHKAAKARIIDFGGWAMPVSYTSILAEHKAVRTAVGLFDVCHMGEVSLVGPGALAAVERLVTNDVRNLQIGQARYTVVCYPEGGIVDDCIVYRRGIEDFLIVINAANIDKDLAWFREQTAAMPGFVLTDLSAQMGLIAVQGPAALSLCERLFGGQGLSASSLRSFTFRGVHYKDIPLTVARTGYTGEDGVEIFCPQEAACTLWDLLLSSGADLGILPCGLGARDTLRLEACLSLYGNDIDATTTPYEAGLGWVVKLDHDFIGKEALAKQKADGISRKLCGLVMEGRGTARHGYAIYASEGLAASGPSLGVITSGSIGPTVGKDIALGYLPKGKSDPGTRVYVDNRGKPLLAQVVKTPFYKRPQTLPQATTQAAG